jgi:hypothetical protein
LSLVRCHYLLNPQFLTAFDPKPFIRTFDAVVDNLISLRRDVQRKTEHQEQSTRNAEKDYSNKLADLNRGFEVRSQCRYSTLESPENMDFSL